MGIAKRIGLLILEIFIFLVVAIFIGVLIVAFLSLGDGYVADYDPSFMDPYHQLMSNFLPQTIAVSAALIFVKRICFPLSEEKLGFSSYRIFKDSYIGWGYGLLLVGFGFLLMLIFQLVAVRGVDWNLSLFVGFILLFIIQSFSEEVIFRAFLIPTIEEKFNLFWALIISSIVFALVHLSNPNVSPVGVINLIIGGFLMGLLFIKYQNIWAPTGFHASWNFVQSAFLGYPVSGIDTYSFIELEETGPDILSGGKFGYEGSLISVAIILISIIWIILKDDRLRARLHPANKNNQNMDATIA